VMSRSGKGKTRKTSMTASASPCHPAASTCARLRLPNTMRNSSHGVVCSVATGCPSLLVTELDDEPVEDGPRRRGRQRCVKGAVVEPEGQFHQPGAAPGVHVRRLHAAQRAFSDNGPSALVSSPYSRAPYGHWVTMRPDGAVK